MRYLLLLLIMFGLVGCAQNPVSGRTDFVMMSESQEVVVGQQNDQKIRQQYHVYADIRLQSYVNQIGQRLVKHSHRPELAYHFTLLDSAEINAFALPGGYVYITRGILAYLNSEAELAAVLGHELGHVTARHGVRQQSAAQAASIGVALAAIFVPELASQGGRQITDLLGGALLSGYGREHELEADRLGAEYLARSGYDPQAMIRVVAALKNQELLDAELAKKEGREPRRYHGLFASHPDNDTRLQQVIAEANKFTLATPREGRNKFLNLVNGMAFNESVDQGVVRNNGFYHAEQGIAMQFPAGWRVQNTPAVVAALAPKGQAVVQLRMGAKPAGSVVDYARKLVQAQGQVAAATIGGMPAALINLPDGLGAVIYKDDAAYILHGQRKHVSFDQTLLQTMHSFHRLTQAERKQVKPLKLQVIKVKAGDNYAQLAKKSPLGDAAESYLRLINGHYPSGEPEAGQRIKIVK